MEQQIGFCTTEDGVRIAYATYGGDGPPLFVLPDIVGQEALWKHADGRAVLETISAGRRLITYDARGTGASGRDADYSAAESYTRDLAAVIDDLALTDVTLFSVSGISSPLALLYTAGHQDRVASLVLWGSLIVKQRITAVDAASFSKMWAWNARAMAALFFPSGPLGLQRWFAKTLVKEQSDWSAAQVMDLEWDLTPMLPRIATPTLILQRESVKLADPRQSTTAARLMPNARLLMMDGDADHAIHDYEQYLDTLLSFLEEHAPAKSERRATGGAPTLTERETEVLSLLAGGRTGREIAEALGISLSTAQRHIANIYGKIGARGRVDAAAYALARGLVTPRE